MKGLKILNKAAEAMSAKAGHSPNESSPDKERAAQQEHMREGDQSQAGLLCPACHAKVQAHLASIAPDQAGGQDA